MSACAPLFLHKYHHCSLLQKKGMSYLKVHQLDIKEHLNMGDNIARTFHLHYFSFNRIKNTVTEIL